MKEPEKKTNEKDEPKNIWHPTQHDESDELEEAKKVTEEYKKNLKEKKN